MFVIIGIVVVLGAIVGGYLMEHGHLAVLFQPAELVIIGGASLGAMVVGNPPRVLKDMLKAMLGLLGSSKYSKKFYLESLLLLNDLFTTAKKDGLAKLEAHIETPAESELFKKYPNFIKDHHALHFTCDTIRTHLMGLVTPYDLDQIMESDMEVHHQEVSQSVSALQTAADALPGLGIVAAVLGVIITMGSLGGPPEEIGHKVAAALVGTFLGILMCYGFLGPLAARMEKSDNEHGQYLHVLRNGISSFTKGLPPAVSIEAARRTIPAYVRPTFSELEAAAKGTPQAAAAGQA